MKPFICAASLFFLAASALASGKDFIIYDRMDYVGKPDLTADKLSKVFLIYESELVMPDPAGKRKHGVLNENALANWRASPIAKATAPSPPTSKPGLPKRRTNPHPSRA